MILTYSLDKVLMIQKNQFTKKEVIKTLKKPHGDCEELFALEFSGYHNCILTASNNIILCWNYETLKLMGLCQIKGLEINVIHIATPFPAVLVSDFNNSIYVFQMNTKQESFTRYKCIAVYGS